MGQGLGAGAHAVLPEELVEDGGVHVVGAAKVHVFAFLPFLRVHLIDEAVIAIAIVGGVGRLRAGTAEKRSHDRRAGIVGVHGRDAEKGFDGANDVDGGVEVAFDERLDGAIGLLCGERRIFADDETGAAVGIHVVGTVLGIVFEDEESGVVPIRAVRDGVHDAAYGEIVVGEGSGRSGHVELAAGGMVIGETKLDELRHGVAACLAGGDELAEFVEEFVGAELIGIIELEIGGARIEMAAEFGSGSDVLGEDRDGPGIRARAAAGIADILGKRLSRIDDRARAGDAGDFRRAVGWGVLAFRFIAPAADDEFAVVAIGDSVVSEIFPEEAAGRFACVGEIVFDSDAGQKSAFRIVGVLFASIADGPGFFDIIGDGSRVGPDVAVAGDIATIVEIVEDAELASESVLIGRDVFAVHDERRIAVGGGDIAEDLIVGTIFLDDVDDVMNFLFTGGEADFVGIAAQGVHFRDLVRVGREIRRNACEWNAGERAVHHGGIVGIAGTAITGFAESAVVGAGAAALGGGDEKIVSGGCNDGGIPFGGNETFGVKWRAESELREIEDGDGIGDGVGGEKSFFIGGKSEVFGIAAAIHLTGKLRGEGSDGLAGFGVEDGDGVAVGESDEEARIVATEEKSGGMRAPGEGIGRFFERDEAKDAAGEQIEFGDGGSVPERDEATSAVGGDDGGVGKRAGDALESREVEAMDDPAVGYVEEDSFVGIVASDEETLLAGAHGEGKTRGIGDVLEIVAAEFAGRDFCARGDGDEALWNDLAIVEGIDGDAVAGAAFFLAEGIGEGSHGGVEVLAVEAEGEAEEIGLAGVLAKAGVGEIGEIVGCEIEDGKRLFFAGGVCAVAAVKEDRKFSVGRESDGRGEIVDLARMAGDFAEKLAVGESGERGRGLG